MLSEIIKEEADRHYYLKNSEKLTQEDRISFQSILTGTDENIENSLKTLSRFLYKHYDRKTIIIIDEYDVPLDKAFQNGYYKEMVALIKGIFGQALKTNDFLQFAILTGCLCISKESIFTGLNNFEVLSILNVQYDECFGFTDAEVRKILKDYGLSAHYADMKEWYDGYRFGNTDIYCPWDVIRYSKSLCMDEEAKPEDFWSNSSGNAIVRRFIDKADASTKNEIERLIAGEYIEKEISQELTYEELDDKIENLWSVLFTTGYLTQQGRTDDDRYRLAIPNKEIRNLFIKKVREWFRDASKNDGKALEEFCNAFIQKNSQKIEQLFGDYLWNTISIRDTAVAKEKKENFYHGILLGLLGYKSNWIIKSNAESGTGYSDILIEAPDNIGNALLRIVFKYAWSNCLSTDDQTVFVTDEDHTYIQNEPIAALKAQFQRRARKYNTVTISGTQEVKDYNNDKIHVHGTAIFNNATYKVTFNMELDGILEYGKLVYLTDQEMDTIRFLLPHYCLFQNGNRKIPVHILMSEREKEFFGA